MATALVLAAAVGVTVGLFGAGGSLLSLAALVLALGMQLQAATAGPANKRRG